MIFFKMEDGYRVRNLKLKGKPKLMEWTQPSGSIFSACVPKWCYKKPVLVKLRENRLVRFMNSKLVCRGVLQQHSRSYWGRLWVVCQGGTICWQIGWVRQKHFRRKSECQNLDFMDEKNHRHSSENRRSSREVWIQYISWFHFYVTSLLSHVVLILLTFQVEDTQWDWLWCLWWLDLWGD